jgi:3-hydroxyacyl-CoA dehydrogenase
MKWCPKLLRKIFGKSSQVPKIETTQQANQNIVPERVPPIKKAAVIGAGVMGSGIAAQLANAGIEVVLLDKFPGVAEKAVQRMLKAKLPKDPMNAGFMSPENAKLVTPGNQDDDLDKISDADWICEVIIEDLELKKSLFADIEKVRKPGSIVSSNTSTIPLDLLVEDLPEESKKDYMITHFFNPPRFMKLLEIVSGKDTRADAVEKLSELCDIDLGKSVVTCNDTPGFIANRIGTFMIKRAINEAIDKNLKIEDVDAVMGPPMGFPKMGIFALTDTVGVDLSKHVVESLKDTLPKTDAFQAISQEVPLISSMIKDGRLGRKSEKGEGFYRRGASGKEALELSTGQYRLAEKSSLKSVSAGRKGIRHVFETDDQGGKFAWNVMRDTFLYTTSLIPEISSDISAVDEAMCAGYNWKHGPFSMIDALGNDQEIGVDYLIRKLEEENIEVPKVLQMAKGHPFYWENEGKVHRLTFDFDNEKINYEEMKQPEGVLSLKDIKRTSAPIGGNNDVSIWNIGDGVLCAELHGMKNTLGPDTMIGLNEACDMIDGSNGEFKSLVIYSDNEQFAVGANLGLAGFAMNLGDYDTLEDIIYDGQKTLERLKYSEFPVVAAIGGMALGGGCEIPLHCDAIQAHAETQIGLVEVGVGLIPGWGGCKEYLGRCFEEQERLGPELSKDPPELQAFEKIGTAYFSQSAQDAKNSLFLRPDDGITMNRSRLLADAKQKSLALAENYSPRAPYKYNLAGAPGKSVFRMAADDALAGGMATWHDVRVMEVLGNILSGGNTNLSKVTSEEDLQHLEREGFIQLAKTAQTRARIRNMVSTGKPLREKPLTTDMRTKDIRSMLPAVSLKEREPGNPYLKKNEPKSAELSVDVSTMKPMDAIITTIEQLSSMPSPDLPTGGDPQKLEAIFNQAAMQTKEGTIARLKKNKGMAGLLPAGKLKREVISGFDKSIQKGQTKLSEINDLEEQTKIRASIATMKKYKEVVGKLSF